MAPNISGCIKLFLNVNNIVEGLLEIEQWFNVQKKDYKRSSKRGRAYILI